MDSLKQTINSIIPYLPFRVIKQFIISDNFTPHRVESLHGSVIFVDVVGFTPLSSELAQEGPRGNEALMKIMTEYFSVLISEVRRFGGIVYQFAGDSVLVGFTCEADESEQDNAIRAVTCLLEIQKKVKRFSEVEILNKRYSILSKAGAGSGKYYQILLGNESLYYRPVITGPAVEEAVESEKMALGGETILSRTVWNLLPGLKEGTPRGDTMLLNFFSEIRNGHNFNYSLNNELYNENFLNRTSRFIDPVLFKKFTTGHDGFICEHREVTCVLVRVELYQGMAGDIRGMDDLNLFYTEILQESKSFGGVVIQVDLTDKGNVFFILFGAPIAQENKELMATRMSLRLIDKNKKGDRFPHIQRVQIGITTGHAYCGDLGAPFRKGYTVLGEDINIATRLMTLSESNDIHMDEKSARKIRNEFYLERLENVKLKGIQDPVSVYRIYAEVERLDGFWDSSSSAFVGRESEFGTLMDIYRRAISGRGQVCSIVGEAGIGKSRLTFMLMESIPVESTGIMTGYCYPYERYTPFYPWKEILRLLFEVYDFDTPERNLDKIRTKFASLKSVNEEWRNIIADIIGLPVEESGYTRRLDVRQKNRRIFQIVFQLLAKESIRRPLILIFEDMHWIDEISLDLIKYVASRAGKLPLLILMLHRESEVSRNISLLKNFSMIRLHQIGERDLQKFLHSRYDIDLIDPSFEDELLEKAAGNPFYLELIIQGLIEQSILIQGEEGRLHLNKEKHNFGLPHSLFEIILSRIDRLNETDQAIIKTASVVGSSFDSEILTAILPDTISTTDHGLEDSLNRLLSLQLIRRGKGQSEYLFNHILIRDVTYSTLLLSTREELHLKLALHLEELYKKEGNLSEGTLAYHFELASDTENALSYTLRAASKARYQNDNKDAIFQYEKALEIMQEPKFADRKDLQFQTMEELASVYRQAGIFEESVRLYRECLLYTENNEDRARLYLGLGHTLQEKGEEKAAIQKLEQALSLYGLKVPRNRTSLIFSILYQFFQSILRPGYRGDPARLKKSERDALLTRSYIIRILSRIYYFHDFMRVLWSTFTALRLSRKLNSPYDMSFAYGNFATILMGIGFVNVAHLFMERSLELAKKAEDPVALATILQRRGFYGLYANKPDFTIRNEKEEISILKDIGEKWELLSGLTVLGVGYFYKGELEQSRKTFEELRYLAEEFDSRMHLSWSNYWDSVLDYLMDTRYYRDIMTKIKIDNLHFSKTMDDPLARLEAVNCIISVRENLPEEAATAALITYENLALFRIIIPHMRMVYIYAAEAAIFALRNNVKNVSRRSLIKVARRGVEKILQVSKKIPYVSGSGYRVLAIYYDWKGNKKKAREFIMNSVAIQEKCDNPWERGLAYMDAARIIPERREEYREIAREIFRSKGYKSELRRLDSYIDDKPHPSESQPEPADPVGAGGTAR